MAKSQGLLQVSHVGIAVGHFLPHSVRCEMVAMQDILSAVGIPICFISAAGTGMPAYPKILGDYTLAIATYLGGSMRSNFDHCPTSLRRFVGTECDKCTPSCIQDAFVQSAFGGGTVGKVFPVFVLLGFRGFGHVLDLKIFKDQCPVGIDQLARLFVQEIPSFVTCFSVESRQFFLGTVTPMTAFLAPCDLFVSLFDLVFCIAVDTWVFYEDAIGESSKGVDTQIDANFFFRRMEDHRWIERIFCGENSVPLLSLSFDSTGLDRAFHLTMQFDLDMSNLGEMQTFVDDFVPALWIGEGIIAVSRFKSWVPWFLSILDPSEESIHGLIKSFEHILLHLTVDVLIFFSQGFDSRQLVGLHVVANRHPIHPIGLAPFFKSSIVQLFTASHSPFHLANLLL